MTRNYDLFIYIYLSYLFISLCLFRYFIALKMPQNYVYLYSVTVSKFPQPSLQREMTSSLVL